MRIKYPAIVPFLGTFLLLGCLSKKLTTPSLELKAQAKKVKMTGGLLDSLLHSHSSYFDSLLKNGRYRIQIIYTQIDRKANNKPQFTHFYYHLNPEQYFYPASTVKMPVAFLALQKLNDLNKRGVDKNTTMITESAFDGQTSVYNEPTSEDGRPSVAQYIKKIFLVSDNDAYNRLYEFLGQEYINKQLHGMGYDTAQIIHRLNISRTEEQNRHTNPVAFYNTAAKLIYKQPLVNSTLIYPQRNTFLGKGFYSGNQLIGQPFDFSKKNRMTLADLHSILMCVLFPKSVPAKMRFNLKKEDYAFLYKYMSMMPRESQFPQYDSSYPDAQVKLLLYGGSGAITDTSIRIFNKEGDAYGFLTDVAYVVDFKNGIEFLLSATIYCNADEIFNDDHYDYANVGYPFMKNLGKIIYEYERHRKKKRLPNLSMFRK